MGRPRQGGDPVQGAEYMPTRGGHVVNRAGLDIGYGYPRREPVRHTERLNVAISRGAGDAAVMRQRGDVATVAEPAHHKHRPAESYGEDDLRRDLFHQGLHAHPRAIPAGPQTNSPVHADLGEVNSVSHRTAPLNMSELYVIEDNLIVTD